MTTLRNVLAIVSLARFASLPSRAQITAEPGPALLGMDLVSCASLAAL